MEPIDDATRALLRRAVFGLRQGTRARVFAPLLHLGAPDHATAVVPADTGRSDLALRADLLGALLEQHPATDLPPVWLTRPGQPTPHDMDLAWLAALRQAAAEAGGTVPWFVVVTKYGWHRPATGEQRRWTRLRLA